MLVRNMSNLSLVRSPFVERLSENLHQQGTCSRVACAKADDSPAGRCYHHDSCFIPGRDLSPLPLELGTRPELRKRVRGEALKGSAWLSRAP